MSSNDHPILSRLVAAPPQELTSAVAISVHLDDHDVYVALRDQHNGIERSADAHGFWHRWAGFFIDGVEYTVHDPKRYDTDPLDHTARLAELMDMMARVVHAADMDPAEKVRELSRLSARMREIAPVPDPTDEDLHVIADALVPES